MAPPDCLSELTPKEGFLPILEAFLESHTEILFVKCFWVSVNGFTYCRTLTKCRALKNAKDATPLRVHVSCLAGYAPLSRMEITFASPVGRTQIWPDWSSLRAINSSQAAVQCKVAEDLSLYASLRMPTVFQRCPCSCLERVVAHAKDQYSLVFLVAFELEFYLVEAQDALGPMSTSQGPLRAWSSAACMRGRYAKCVEQCMLALEKADLVVEQGHAECSLNQFEISIGPLPATAAVHAVLCAREIIKDTSEKHGLCAIFLPKPFKNAQPTGLHLHLSVHRHNVQETEHDVEQLTNANTRQTRAISQVMSNFFLAGILRRLRSLCALSMPSSDSYTRNMNGEAMGNYVSWGKENSSVPISEVRVGYWEIRSLDWTANIYLALAVYLSAGLLGICGKESLRCGDPHALTHNLSSEALEKMGITELLPKSPAEAFECFIATKYGGLQEFVGEEILDLFVLVKSAEVEYLNTLGEEEKHRLFMYHT